MAVEGEADQRDACVDNFRGWLERIGTGCTFASSLASRALVHYDIITGASPSADLIEALDATLDEAAAATHVAVTLLPDVHTTSELAAVLRALQTAPRWRVTWLASERWGSRRFAAISIYWKTKAGRLSSVVGFGPLRCIPATRRAPYVAMAVWPAERTVQHSKAPAGETLGIVDAAHGLEDADYDVRWKKTRAEVKAMFVHEREDPKLLRDVAFRLPLGVVDRLLT